jgi:hypothetical protein
MKTERSEVSAKAHIRVSGCYAAARKLFAILMLAVGLAGAAPVLAEEKAAPAAEAPSTAGSTSCS